MANLNIPNSHVDGTVADADDVNANNQAVEDYINDRNDGTEAWDNLKVKETGGDNTITLAVGTHAADRTYTFPDAGGAADIVLTAGAQTIAGAKTFSDPITQNDTTNQIVLGVTNTTTISATAPAASRVVTIPDPGAAASFVMTEGTQTINGAKTFGSTIATSGITNTAGVDIQGTNTNDSASAGYVGEAVRATATSTNTGSSLVWGDLTSISLTAGDWDVSAVIIFSRNTATWTEVSCGISSTSGNSASGLVDGDNRVDAGFASSATTPVSVPMNIPNFRVSLSGTTTYYLKFRSEFSAGQPQAYGRLSARRVR